MPRFPSEKASVYRVTVNVPDGDVTATVVRGVGFRYVCSCGEKGKRQPTWAVARADMKAHLAAHAESLGAPAGV